LLLTLLKSCRPMTACTNTHTPGSWMSSQTHPAPCMHVAHALWVHRTTGSSLARAPQPVLACHTVPILCMQSSFLPAQATHTQSDVYAEPTAAVLHARKATIYAGSRLGR
jgi:hypothetical protein